MASEVTTISQRGLGTRGFTQTTDGLESQSTIADASRFFRDAAMGCNRAHRVKNFTRFRACPWNLTDLTRCKMLYPVPIPTYVPIRASDSSALLAQLSLLPQEASMVFARWCGLRASTRLLILQRSVCAPRFYLQHHVLVLPMVEEAKMPFAKASPSTKGTDYPTLRSFPRLRNSNSSATRF